MSSLKFLISKFDESIAHAFVGDVDFPIQGLFVVDLLDGAQIDPPTDYTDLKTKKEASFAALYPDFANTVYNELDNDSAVDRTISTTRAHTGSYEWMLPRREDSTNGIITTTNSTLSGSPVEAVVFWNVYAITRSAGDVGFDLTYTELASTTITVEATFDNGANWESVTDATPFLPTNTGTNFRLRFTNSSTSQDRYIGYYTLMYRT